MRICPYQCTLDEVLAVLAATYGQENAARWNQRWRMFWMSCAELFGYDAGREWLVAHYRFSKAAATAGLPPNPTLPAH